MSAAARLTRMIDAADPDVRAAYNDAETLAEFGEWCALRLFGGTPERLTAATQAKHPARG